jgi:hypothetical protein
MDAEQYEYKPITLYAASVETVITTGRILVNFIQIRQNAGGTQDVDFLDNDDVVVLTVVTSGNRTNNPISLGVPIEFPNGLKTGIINSGTTIMLGKTRDL